MIKLAPLLLEDRLEAMKDKLKLSSNDIKYLKSLNIPGKYILWVAKQYKLSLQQHKSLTRFKEDAYKYEEALKKFNELSVKNKIKDKDINHYKNISAVYDAVEKFEDVKSNRELEKNIKIGGAEKIFESDKWLVVVPKTEEAACYYGKGTRWCTSAVGGGNSFNDYNEDGSLFIFINKKDSNERYQLHVTTDQFMDAKDEEVDLDMFEFEHPELEFAFLEIYDYVVSDFVRLHNLKYNTKTKGYVSHVSIDIPSYLVKNGKLLIKFDSVYDGSFECSEVGLRTLEGCPMYVEDDFICSGNALDTLYGAPKEVGGDFICDYNGLGTLKGAPEYVGGKFSCINNSLVSLEGLPKKIDGNIECDDNRLTSLVGAPRDVKGSFSCSYNELIDLRGAPQTVRDSFWCNDNILTTLEGAPRIIGASFICSGNRLGTLTGAPRRVGKDFVCITVPTKFSENDVRTVSNVGRKVIVRSQS